DRLQAATRPGEEREQFEAAAAPAVALIRRLRDALDAHPTAPARWSAGMRGVPLNPVKAMGLMVRLQRRLVALQYIPVVRLAQHAEAFRRGRRPRRPAWHDVVRAVVAELPARSSFEQVWDRIVARAEADDEILHEAVSGDFTACRDNVSSKCPQGAHLH